jgi:uncharacterized protein with HEPN domain
MFRDEAILLDVVNAARRSIEFVSGLKKSDFESDVKTQSAVIHQLLILGEAVKRLSEEFRSRYPDIPWRSIAGMRDKLIHAYDDVDLDEVWKTIRMEIPELLGKLDKIVPHR